MLHLWPKRQRESSWRQSSEEMVELPEALWCLSPRDLSISKAPGWIVADSFGFFNGSGGTPFSTTSQSPFWISVVLVDGAQVSKFSSPEIFFVDAAKAVTVRVFKTFFFFLLERVNGQTISGWLSILYRVAFTTPKKTVSPNLHFEIEWNVSNFETVLVQF